MHEINRRRSLMKHDYTEDPDIVSAWKKVANAIENIDHDKNELLLASINLFKAFRGYHLKDGADVGGDDYGICCKQLSKVHGITISINKAQIFTDLIESIRSFGAKAYIDTRGGCDILLVSSRQILATIYNPSYVRVQGQAIDQLCFVNPKSKENIPLNITPKKLKQFDTEIKINKLTKGHTRELTIQELKNITSITGHTLDSRYSILQPDLRVHIRTNELEAWFSCLDRYLGGICERVQLDDDKGEQCDIVFSSSEPTVKNSNSLLMNSNKAYIRYNKKLDCSITVKSSLPPSGSQFFEKSNSGYMLFQDENEKKYTITYFNNSRDVFTPLNVTPDQFAQFVAEIKIQDLPNVANSSKRALSDEELEKITEITGHIHTNIVNKSLYFFDKIRGIFEKVELSSPEDLEKFDRKMKIDELTEDKSRTLSDEELKQIGLITDFIERPCSSLKGESKYEDLLSVLIDSSEDYFIECALEFIHSLSVNQVGYNIRLLDGEVGLKIRNDTLYIRQRGIQFEYTVRNPSNKVVNGIITEKDLGGSKIKDNSNNAEEEIRPILDFDQINPLLLKIFKITSERGHTSQISNTMQVLNFDNPIRQKQLIDKSLWLIADRKEPPINRFFQLINFAVNHDHGNDICHDTISELISKFPPGIKGYKEAAPHERKNVICKHLAKYQDKLRRLEQNWLPSELATFNKEKTNVNNWSSIEQKVGELPLLKMALLKINNRIRINNEDKDCIIKPL